MPKLIKLKNGAVLIYRKNKENNGTGFFVGVNCGGFMDNNSGISHLFEHLLFKSTKNRDNAKLFNDIKEKFLNLDAVTTKDLMGITGFESSRNFEGKFEIICDMLTNVQFDKDSVEKEKQIVLHEINTTTKEEKPLRPIVYNYPEMKFDIIGSSEKMLNITIDDLENYYKENIVNARLIVSLNTNLSLSRIKKLTNKYLVSKLKEGSPQSLNPHNFKINTDSSLTVVKNNKEKVLLEVIWPCSGEDNYLALKYLATIKKYFVSTTNPLAVFFREKNQLCYSSGIISRYMLNDGYFGVALYTMPKYINKCIETLKDMIDSLKCGLSEEEFVNFAEKLKDRQDTLFPNHFETARTLASIYLVNKKVNFSKDRKLFNKNFNCKNFNKHLINAFTFDKVWVRVMGNVDKKDVYSIKKIEQILKGK